MKQISMERIADYVKRVAKENANYGISDKEALEVAIAGMKEGRVERFNRTLMEMIYKNKQDKILYAKLTRARDVYNNSFHTGVEMTPLEAKKPEILLS